MKNRVSFFFFCLLFGPLSFAQDAVFSQFYNERGLLNPALTGLDEGSSFSLQHRQQWYSQWPNRFQTTAGCLECRTENTGLGTGLYFSHDREGAGAFNTLNINTSLSANIPLRGNSGIHGGLIGGYGEKFVDFDNLVFSDQINAFTTQLDPSLSNLPATAADMPNKVRFLTVGMGLAFRGTLKVFKKGGINQNPFFSIGGALQHISNINESLVGMGDTKLPRRYTLHTGLTIPFPKDWVGSKIRYWHWTALGRVWTQQGLTAYSLGIQSTVNNWGFTVLTARGRQFFSSQNANAIVLATSYEWTNTDSKRVFRLEGSYDIPTGQVSTQMGGVLELSLRMQWKQSCPFGKNKKTKPKRQDTGDCPKMGDGRSLRDH